MALRVDIHCLISRANCKSWWPARSNCFCDDARISMTILAFPPDGGILTFVDRIDFCDAADPRLPDVQT